ncbi:MAG TPA: molybdopterin-dependent oxidoreductase [Trueperaceae bacterium]
MHDLGFPLWIRLTHFFNILFLSMLFRSGVEILGGHPMLYWNDDSTPGSEWLRFTKKKMPADEPWTAEDEKEPYSPVIALPGHDNLGLGRYWHFSATLGWILTGLVYLVLLFATPEWRRLIPTSWSVFPQAYQALLSYLSLQIPHTPNVFNALQQLVYAGVIFILAPLQILTGIAMSPAVAGRFPWYTRPFGGRQAARSIHFLGLVLFAAFTVHHTAIVIAHGLGGELAKIVLGVENATADQARIAAFVAVLAVLLVLAVHVWATIASLESPRRIQRWLQGLVDPVRHALFHGLRSRQHYDAKQLTQAPRANGRPPKDPEHQTLVRTGFDGWRLHIGGLVEEPQAFTLEELRALPSQTQTTKHCCIQGWSYIAEWRGVPLGALLDRCRPLPGARYVLFRTFDDKWEVPDNDLGYFYGTVDLELARHPQTILAYDMNGGPLPIEFGAPLRLRLETQLGFKMTKWVRAIELIEDYRTLGLGNGGWREDRLHYSQSAPI